MLTCMQIYNYRYVDLTMKTDKMVVPLKGVEIIIIFILYKSFIIYLPINKYASIDSF